MPSFCCVPDCSMTYGYYDPDISYHKFPSKNPTLLDKWVNAVGREDSWKPSKWSSVCSRHFESGWFKLTKNKRCLVSDAFPSLFTSSREIRNFGNGQNTYVATEANEIMNVVANTIFENEVCNDAVEILNEVCNDAVEILNEVTDDAVVVLNELTDDAVVVLNEVTDDAVEILKEVTDDAVVVLNEVTDDAVEILNEVCNDNVEINVVCDDAVEILHELCDNPIEIINEETVNKNEYDVVTQMCDVYYVKPDIIELNSKAENRDDSNMIRSNYELKQLRQDIHNYCRICATFTENIDNLQNIFEDSSQIIDKISECLLPVVLIESDQYPNVICKSCVAQINNFIEFIEIARCSDDVLNDILNELENESPNHNIQFVSCNDIVTKKIKQEPLFIKEERQTQDHNTPNVMENNKTEYSAQPKKNIIIHDVISFFPNVMKTECMDTTENDKYLNISNLKTEYPISEDFPKTIRVPNSDTLKTKGPIVCDIMNCNRLFTDMKAFDCHIDKMHLQSQNHNCQYCNISATSKTQFNERSCNSFEHLVKKSNVVNDQAVIVPKQEILLTGCVRQELNPAVREDFNNSANCSVRVVNTSTIALNIPSVNPLVPIDNKLTLKTDIVDAYKCGVCCKQFENNFKFREHSLIHVLQHKVCGTCKKDFKSRYEYSVHKQTCVKNAINSFSCDKCYHVFSGKLALNHHKRFLCTNSYLFKCAICGLGFSKKIKLANHILTHKNSNSKTRSLLNHRKLQFLGKSNPIPICDLNSTKTGSGFVNGAINDQLKLPEIKENEIISSDVNQTKETKQVFLVAPHLRSKVINSAKSSGKNLCDICGRSYSRYSNLTKHKRLHKPILEWQYQCSQCHKMFERLRDLQNHSTLCTDGDKNSAITDLVEISSKLVKNPWTCRYCGKQTTSKTSLTDHERIHTGAKPFICDQCGVQFRSSANLAQHVTVHSTMKKTYPCSYCKKTFARKSNLKSHISSSHYGLKQFGCTICSKKFSQKGTLKKHNERAHS